MAGETAFYVRAKVQDLFPPNDPLVPPLLRLIPAVHDLRTLQKAWLYSSHREGKTLCEKEIIKAENSYLFRLTCATVHEAGRAFQDLRLVLSASLANAMPDEARQAFATLQNRFAAGFHKNTSHGKTLARIRKGIYHYPTPKECLTELKRHDELGTLIIGRRPGGSVASY